MGMRLQVEVSISIIVLSEPVHVQQSMSRLLLHWFGDGSKMWAKQMIFQVLPRVLLSPHFLGCVQVHSWILVVPERDRSFYQVFFFEGSHCIQKRDFLLMFAQTYKKLQLWLV